MQCPNSDIQRYKNKYISMMSSMSHQLEDLTGNDKILLLYILKGHDVILLPNIIEWLDLCKIKYTVFDVITAHALISAHPSL